MSSLDVLFEPVRMGALTLPNRIVMAPMTRHRAYSDGTPRDWARKHYADRASAGLIIAEATQVSDLGKGYLDTPGIYTDSHVRAWKGITDAVHREGGRMFCQLWHVGRICHDSLLPDGEVPVAPSAIRADAKTFTEEGFVATSQPRALELGEVAEVVQQFRQAAVLAIEAGFDGVEVHGANGYLLDQFMNPNSNTREDEYGGSKEKRARFVLEIMDEVVEALGADRVGIRLSPGRRFNGMDIGGAEDGFAWLIDQLQRYELAYVHFAERAQFAEFIKEDADMVLRLRRRVSGFYIANGEYDAAKGARSVSDGHAHAVAYARPYISNPDLVERFRRGAALNEIDADRLYGGDEAGYNDYPALKE
jgi:N-ethylmaleimide reductase